MAIRLSKGKQGVLYRIVEIKGKSDTYKFLSNIGLSEGDTIVIMSKLVSNYIVNIKDSRFGIDEGIAELLMVES
jgi:ferrous iron transport protein A